MGTAFRLSPALKAVAFFAEVVEKYSGEFSVFIALEMVVEHKIVEAEQRTFAETLSVRKLGGEPEKSIRKLNTCVPPTAETPRLNVRLYSISVYRLSAPMLGCSSVPRTITLDRSDTCDAAALSSGI